MAKYVPWDSQPLAEWSEKYAAGKHITLGGRSTHIIEAGSGPPVILIHGFFFDSFTWNNNIETLSERFHVLAPDLWGFGYSTRDPLDYGYQLFADQILMLMDELGVAKASLIGHSMGGGTAIYFAAHHPDRVNKLILVDAVGMPNPLPWLGRFTNLPLVGELMYGMRGDFIRKMALKTNWIYDADHMTDDYFERATRFHKVQGSSKVMLKILRKQFFNTLMAEVQALRDLEIPILIVWGRHDTAVPLERGREMHSLLAGSKLKVFDDVGHCPHDEASIEFNRVAIDFLSSE